MHSGLSLQILSPAPGRTCSRGAGPCRLLVQATLGCGCPAGAGGRFDYRRFQVRALVFQAAGEPFSLLLTPAAAVSTFEGWLQTDQEGAMVLEITACDPESGLAGRARGEFTVVP